MKVTYRTVRLHSAEKNRESVMASLDIICFVTAVPVAGMIVIAPSVNEEGMRSGL